MRSNFLFFIAVIILFLSSCERFCKYPGYRKAEHGIYYQLHKIGEDTLKAGPGDYITVNLTYGTMGDSTFFKATRKLQVHEPAFKGAVDECFMMLSEEESATFIISAGDFFGRTLQTRLPGFLDTGSSMKITVEMLEIQTREEFEREKEAFLSWTEDLGDYEKVILEQFIREEKMQVSPLPSGVFYLNLRPGSGKMVETGDTVTVNYEGRFLNGRFFDSTVKRNQPFQFVYGTEWQVIKGLEDAIGLMREGEKSLFIMPSDQGFGNRGSSTGVIPPFTSLIFEVEILKVSSSRKI
ncbi:MAG TPA: FKBP-type peptidyl-prolyl cis-trans isomerase [Bacteroidales bacterium]|nr:FKBP-type peptidyl-prolyl cis-trans isomerase [Bacteroidales bacterium]